MSVTALVTVIGTVIGSLYGGFLMYQKIEEAIAFVGQQSEYEEKIAGYEQRMEIIEKELAATKGSVQEATGYANEIKNDLKGDIRRIEGVVDGVERASKENTRDVQTDLRSFRVEMKTLDRELREDLKTQDTDVRDRMDRVEAELNEKLQEALDNPLNNK